MNAVLIHAKQTICRLYKCHLGHDAYFHNPSIQRILYTWDALVTKQQPGY